MKASVASAIRDHLEVMGKSICSCLILKLRMCDPKVGGLEQRSDPFGFIRHTV